MVANAGKHGSGVLATIVGLVTILFGATGVFVQLQSALNRIWDVEPKPGDGVWGFVRTRLLSFGMVLGIGFLLLVSLVVTAAVAAVGTWATGLLPGAEVLVRSSPSWSPSPSITLLFAMIFKVLPDVKIAWRDVWIGAAVTALLFTIGKFLIGLYLGKSSVASTYGAAGSLVDRAALGLLLVADPLPGRGVHAGLREPLRLADRARASTRCRWCRRRRWRAAASGRRRRGDKGGAGAPPGDRTSRKAGGA